LNVHTARIILRLYLTSLDIFSDKEKKSKKEKKQYAYIARNERTWSRHYYNPKNVKGDMLLSVLFIKVIS